MGEGARDEMGESGVVGERGRAREGGAGEGGKRGRGGSCSMLELFIFL